jgi:hypothetical protein
MAMLHQLGFGFWAIAGITGALIYSGKQKLNCVQGNLELEGFHKLLHDMFDACQALPLLAQCVSAWLCLYIGGGTTIKHGSEGLFQIVMPVSTSTRSSMRSRWCLRNLTSLTSMETHQTQATMARRENLLYTHGAAMYGCFASQEEDFRERRVSLSRPSVLTFIHFWSELGKIMQGNH